MTYPSGKPCLNCAAPCGVRIRRGLCRACYARAAVRERYPLTGTLAGSARGNGHVPEGEGLPTTRTTFALPGSPEKRVELRRRGEAGEALFVRTEPALPLSSMAYLGPPWWPDRAVDHAALWRTLALHDPGILELLEQVSAERRGYSDFRPGHNKGRKDRHYGVGDCPGNQR